MTEFHPVRAEILYHLRHTQTARFSQLMKPSGLESDAFKFHIRALRAQGYIAKAADGSYTLTASGKEVANNLDQSRVQTLRQPKLSLCMVVWRSGQQGAREYLVQQRKRQPFYDYWGCMSGPAQWGEDFELTAQAELAKQCGLTDVQCQVRSFYRQRDYLQDSAEDDAKDRQSNAQNSSPKNTPTSALLEDKLFVIIEAIADSLDAFPAKSESSDSLWPGGTMQWMTLSQLHAQQKVFANSLHMLKLIDDNEPVVPLLSGKTQYRLDQY